MNKLLLLRVIILFPLRINRLLLHFIPFFLKSKDRLRISGISEWISDMAMYILDISGLPDIITQLRVLTTPRMRLLTSEEKKILRIVYGEWNELDSIWLDPSNRLGTNSLAHAYVLHNTINYRNSISKDILVHEAMHCLQYQMFGSIYITRSLKAQRSSQGYDYGGGQGLYNSMISQKDIWDFNFEQQAQIMQDYYLIIAGKLDPTPLEYTAYKFYVNQVRSVLSLS